MIYKKILFEECWLILHLHYEKNRTLLTTHSEWRVAMNGPGSSQFFPVSVPPVKSGFSLNELSLMCGKLVTKNRK